MKAARVVSLLGYTAEGLKVYVPFLERCPLLG